jgi:hypothetical protein
MEKLDRLGWAEAVSFIAFGVRIGVRVSAAELLDPLLSHLPVARKRTRSSIVDRLYSLIGGGAASRPSVRRFNLLYGDTQQLARSLNLEELYWALESDVDFYIGQATRRRLFVHAGVVGWKGRAIVIPGRSHSGKSTLVKAFVQAGATYYSDEYAVLDQRGAVYPFPRPISLREEADKTITKITPEQLGGQTGARPLPVGLLVLTHYQPGEQWRPKALSSGRGVLAMLANALAAREQPERAFATLKKAVCKAQVLKGARGEAIQTAESILESFESTG